jgi:hypothetical protein
MGRAERSICDFPGAAGHHFNQTAREATIGEEQGVTTFELFFDRFECPGKWQIIIVGGKPEVILFGSVSAVATKIE